MIVATLIGIAVNAARPTGIALIQQGEAVATVQHGEADSTAAAAPREGVVTIEEMKQIVDAGGSFIIDARSTTEYEEGHLPGSINIPHDRLPEFMEVLNNEVATDARVICGTVQLLLDQPENQPHRADLAKMLVHRRVRRQGIGEALLRAAEAAAIDCGKTLLVLDTASDAAERLYARLGWVRVGAIPDYALLPRGGLCSTTLFYRVLAPHLDENEPA